jgi:hypothetical protein
MLLHHDDTYYVELCAGGFRLTLGMYDAPKLAARARTTRLRGIFDAHNATSTFWMCSRLRSPSQHDNR